MCLQCATNAITLIEDVLPGYALMQATKSAPEWGAGEYGLVRCNDPDFVWKSKPICDPTASMADEEIGELTNNDPRWVAGCQHFEMVTNVEPRFNTSPYEGYLLVKACMEAGYDPEKDGTRVISWLMDYLARKLDQSPLPSPPW